MPNPSNATPTPSNRVLGSRYTVQDKIGTGGMAIVYRGLDKVLGRTVAIKTMLPQYAADPSFAARFKQEAQAAAALQSPYIVSVYDWGKDGDTYYIIMEYLRGTDLKTGIRKHGALDCRKVAQIGSQIAQALSVAHRHDIIHRDIKPQNIMVQPDGNIKVMDFGIARAKNSHLTTDNSVLGTAHYVSPEQTQGKELGPTTDIYSLGIVMYEAATGRVPFDGDDAISVALKQVKEQPKPPSQINPRVDPALESIILKCMQKEPKDRFQSADALYHVLRDYLAGRLQAVNNATAVITPAVSSVIGPDAGVGGSTGPISTSMRPQQVMRPIPAQNTSHLQMPSATEEAQKRKKHRRRTVMGVLVALIAIAAIAVGVLFSNRTTTRTVPNLIGLTQDDALAQIDQSDYFERGNVKESYSDSADQGTVIDQTPNAYKQAEEGTAIDIVVSKGKAPAADVTVPDITGMDASAANEALAKVGLIGQAGDSVYSSDVETGKVAQQDPAANSTAKAGSTVTYNLSKGTETVSVPNVLGMSESQATSTLEAAGFSVITNSDTSDQYDAGTVCKQSASGAATKGSQVVITISTGSNTATVPSVVGLSQGDASAMLQEEGFTVMTYTDSTSNEAAGTVTNQSPAGGEADKGSTVTIYVSAGPKTNTTTTTDDSSTDTNTATVPSVVGLSQGDASAMLQEEGFTVMTYTDSTSNEAAGTVTNQSPAGGEADKGSTVTIYVSAGPKTNTTTTPSTDEPSTNTTTTWLQAVCVGRRNQGQPGRDHHLHRLQHRHRAQRSRPVPGRRLRNAAGGRLHRDDLHRQHQQRGCGHRHQPVPRRRRGRQGLHDHGRLIHRHEHHRHEHHRHQFRRQQRHDYGGSNY